MKHLICHVATPCPRVDSLEVELNRSDAYEILLRYRLQGDTTMFLFPEPKASAFADELWQHTCFELFLALKNTPGYYEFNFSPSGQWAAYAFSGYRIRIPWTLSGNPIIEFTRNRHEAILTARLNIAELFPSVGNARVDVGISAVVKMISGDLCYWALHHPRERPDFHDRAGFVWSWQT